MMIGNLYPSNGQNGEVYTTDGLSPAILSGQGVNGHGIGSCNAPKIILLDDYNQSIRSGDVIGSVTTTFGASALRNGWKIIEAHEENGTPGRLQPECGGRRCGGDADHEFRESRSETRMETD